jgi:[FeFe] hydrogenase H-cluster maturation GTPase HydF
MTGKGKSRTIRGDRLHVGFFGKRNAGKSSLINAVSGQSAAIVSEVPGTTTDPVFKAMELHPLGPVVLIDTAGLDDTSSGLGELRKQRTEKVLEKTDMAILIIDAGAVDFSLEAELMDKLEKEQVPHIVVLNKVDRALSVESSEWLEGKPFMPVSAKHGTGIDELKQEITEKAPRQWEPPFIRDLIRPGDIVILVVPIDLGAPRGRLIMPQVKALRDILDADGIPVMCKDRELPAALRSLKENPALVVTDSQVFPQVAADVPPEVLLTSFSILSARQKGDLGELVAGVTAVNRLKPGDRVLIAEACTHHPMTDDIGRVKIPRWLNNYVGGGLDFVSSAGSDYPEDLRQYKLVVHCGACTLNRKEMLHRQERAKELNIPITNYGLLISFLKGVFPRALKPFPELYALFDKEPVSADKETKKKMAMLTEI